MGYFDSTDTLFGIGILLVILLILSYVYMGPLLEHKKIRFIHESGYGIIVGFLLGFIITEISITWFQDNLKFNSQYFFYIFLPLIVFSQGYNLQKRRFFQNFSYISLYGISSTLINFFVTYLFTMMINSYGWIRRYDEFGHIITLNVSQMLLFSATISATGISIIQKFLDSAAVNMIKSHKFPKLFSIILGEGMVNDCVSIILFQSVQNLVGSNVDDVDFQFGKSLQVLGIFIEVALGSIAIGLFVGLICCFVMRKSHFVTHESEVESAMILGFGLLSYMSAELATFNGVISILVSSLVMAHFNFYNLSNTGQVSSKVLLSTLGLLAEGILYLYLGLSCWQYRGDGSKYAWSWTFVLLEILIIIVARCVSIILPSILAIIGVVAFALINRLQDPTLSNSSIEGQQVIQSSILCIIVITTLIFGAVMPYFIAFNLKKINERFGPEHHTRKDSLLDKTAAQLLEEIKGETKESKKYISTIQRKMREFDEKYFRPLFIYKYNERKDDIQSLKRLLKVHNEHFDGGQVIQQEFLLQCKMEIDKIDMTQLMEMKKKQDEEEMKELMYDQQSNLYESIKNSIRNSESIKSNKKMIDFDQQSQKTAPIHEISKLSRQDKSIQDHHESFSIDNKSEVSKLNSQNDQKQQK